MTKIRVVMAEDVPMVRGALAALLRLEDDIEVVGDVGDGAEVMDLVERTTPDVVLLDIDLPGVDGITLAARIRERWPATRTLMLTSLSRPGTVRKALDAKVDGYLLKDAEPDELPDAVRAVHAGRRVASGDLLISAFERGDCPLTSRELDVLRLAAAGENPREIARALFLSPGTVRNYLTSILTKLNAKNRVDAIRAATEAGWL